jgi:hypothetical protein
MGKINWPRVILGGIVAGLIINLFEFILNGVILAEDMNAAISALGRHLGGPELLMFTTWAFLVGIFAVWLYAAIRPRYGAGPKTALAAAAGGLVSRVSLGRRHTACTEALPDACHGHWPCGGTRGSHRGNDGRSMVVSRGSRLTF